MFNHQAVNEVLARWGVIPLNSPAYYAPYNGAIEQGIKELKQEMARALPVPDSWNVAQVGSFVAVAAAQRNYQPRRCLGGANAKDIYSRKQRRGRWNQRQRLGACFPNRARSRCASILGCTEAREMSLAVAK